MLFGHVFSDEPGVIGCLGVLIIIHPRPDTPAGGDQPPTCVQKICPHKVKTDK